MCDYFFHRRQTRSITMVRTYNSNSLLKEFCGLTIFGSYRMGFLLID